jgi:PHD/YefM family antitoxin component YafN of YafNO toxin-antitoxin module
MANKKKFEGQYIVDKNGKRTAVVLPVQDYEELLQDIHDLLIVAERREEYNVNFKELKKRLKKDGLI